MDSRNTFGERWTEVTSLCRPRNADGKESNQTANSSLTIARLANYQRLLCTIGTLLLLTVVVKFQHGLSIVYREKESSSNPALSVNMYICLPSSTKNESWTQILYYRMTPSSLLSFASNPLPHVVSLGGASVLPPNEFTSLPLPYVHLAGSPSFKMQSSAGSSVPM